MIYLVLLVQFPRVLRSDEGGEVHAADVLHPAVAHVRGAPCWRSPRVRVPVPGGGQLETRDEARHRGVRPEEAGRANHRSMGRHAEICE